LLIGQGGDESLAYLFDGLHTSYANMRLDLLADSSPEHIEEFRKNAALIFGNAMQSTRKHGRIYCPMIIPGFDNVKSSPARVKANRYNGQTYRTLWDEAIKTKPDWILISSWNEWPEDTEIEPSLELGDQYLDITAEYAKRFLESSPVKADFSIVEPPKHVAEETNNIDELLHSKMIGLLSTGGSYDAEFWADYCGATVQRLNWPDLIDSTEFNANKFPIFIYSGGEHFVSSVKVTDDVTSALVRYLHEGGFLVALPIGGVWPFFYDQSRGDQPDKISDKLGLGVTGAWDTPPAGSDLKFYPNKMDLIGLPPMAKYPTNGDLRFRPALRSQVASYDHYLTLVQLWDKRTHYQGDAAAYIEHEAAPLAPGKTLYVSLQTSEAFSSDKFYPSLYQFISTKLKPPSSPIPK
jgi:hypothetical protein